MPWGEFADFHFKALAGEDALLATFDRAAQVMRATPLLESVETRLEHLGAIACVLDTSADVFGGDEINRQQVASGAGTSGSTG